MRFVDTSKLRVGYEEWNAQGARTVVLLHGWPDSPRCWQEVAPTTVLDPATPRTGQLAALGRDVLELIDALGLEQPVLVGHDWGSRAAANACGLRRDCASALVMISTGYGTNVPGQAISLEQARNYWYHWFMATPRGERTVRADPRAFARIMWDTWAPAGWYRPEEFEATAAAFDNPDWADVTFHSYRHRWGHAPGDPAYEADDRVLDPAPVLAVPTLVLHGEADSVNLPAMSAGKEGYFSGRYQRTTLPGVGHFPPREAPALVAQAILDFLKDRA
jgi:pimeloyl-ACP methyl ester carboxylesterase